MRTDAAFKAGTSSLCGVDRDPCLLHGSEESRSDLPRPPSACSDGDCYVLGLLQRPHGRKARFRSVQDRRYSRAVLQEYAKSLTFKKLLT